ncbi:MAG: tetratricopeptide repeat protein, partial [Acidobacteriota bacterium]|nr:tetratricopeptide repeat protein [Acidobacteriota bacterium]
MVAATLAACKSDPLVEARNHLDRGNQQFEKQKYPEAIIEYRRAVQADPRLGDARLQLAQAYATTGDGPNALREFARAAELLPDDTAAQVKAGNFMLLASRFDDAQGLANRMLQHNPSNVDAQILLANSLAGLRDIDGAVAAFEKAVALEPNRAATYSELGSVQLGGGNKDAAEAAFRKAIELDPESANAHLALANFFWATGNMPESEKGMRRALQIEPDNLVGNRAMAMYHMLTNTPAAAEPHLKVVARVSPNIDAKYFLAEYYMRLGKVDEARAILTPLVAAPESFVGASIRLARV